MKTINITSNNPQYVKIKDEEILELIPLGAGSEVGRSCMYMKFAGLKIMFDCGIHPAYNGLVSLPFFDMIDPSEIDLLLITHFHLDHCGALPYFLTKTNFKGKCYMTQPTKELYKFLISDYIKVSHVRTEEALYNENDLEKSYPSIKEIDFKQTISLNIKNTNIKFTAFTAGHVLGAAMFHIEIEDVSILYTGDYSREEDRHLQPAEVPNIKVNILIVESTYGIQKHESRSDREQQFKKLVADVVRKRGKCLLPVMISGRVQELLLILEEFWGREENKDIRDVKIFFVSSLATKCLDIFKKNINIMGEKIKRNHLVEGTRNPFDFEHIISVKNMEEMLHKGYDESKPVVVFASPGMLQQGLSKDLFEKWYDSENNATIITGYCVEGTFAKELLKDHEEIKLSNGKKVKLKMKVYNVTFSAHSDFNDTSNFIETLKPKKVVLVHGENREMKRLKEEMERKLKHKYEQEINMLKEENKDKSVNKEANASAVLLKSKNNLYNMKIYNPQNCQKIQFFYKMKRLKQMYIVGNLYNKLNNLINNEIKFNTIVKTSVDNTTVNESNFNSTNYKTTNRMLVDDNTESNQHNNSNNNDNITTNNSNQEVDYFAEQNFVEFNGIVVDDKILEEEDIQEYTDYIPMKLRNILQIKYTKSKDYIIYSLQYLYKLKVRFPNEMYNECVSLKLLDRKVILEWVSSPISDNLADSIAQVVFQIENFPGSYLAKTYVTKESVNDNLKEKLIRFFNSKYYLKVNNEFDKISIFSSSDYKDTDLVCDINLETLDMKNHIDITNKFQKNVELYDKIKTELEFFLSYLC